MDLLQNPLVLGAIAFAVGMLAFKFDTRIEGRRRHAIELAGKLSGMGFTKIPKILNDYGVGDYSGFTRGIMELKEDLSDPEKRRAEMEKVFKLLLAEAFKDPERRPQLLKLIEDLRRAHDPDYEPESAEPAAAA